METPNPCYCIWFPASTMCRSTWLPPVLVECHVHIRKKKSHTPPLRKFIHTRRNIQTSNFKYYVNGGIDSKIETPKVLAGYLWPCPPRSSWRSCPTASGASYRPTAASFRGVVRLLPRELKIIFVCYVHLTRGWLTSPDGTVDIPVIKDRYWNLKIPIMLKWLSD